MSTSAPTPSDGSVVPSDAAGSESHGSDLFANDTTATQPPDAAPADGPTPTGSARTDQASDLPPAPAAPPAPSAPDAPAAPSTPTGGLASLIGDDSIAHVFDQTNGVVDRLDGDSDGTIDSDTLSGAERAEEDPASLAYADTEVARSADTDDSRATGS